MGLIRGLVLKTLPGAAEQGDAGRQSDEPVAIAT